MNSELTENVQNSIRPGEMFDSFYYGDTNSEKQAYPCIVNNKFIQQFTNLGAGTSQFIVSPYQGISDFVVYMKMPTVTATGYGLPTGWGYSMIRQVSVRYGSSAQFFFSGEQIYLQNIVDCEDSVKRDQLVSLGGNATTSTSGAEAYLYLNLPHNSPRADGKPLPFPSDLLVQPIVITIELNNPNSVFIDMDGSSPSGSLPTTLAEASLQVKQEMMSDSADLLARRVDMNSHAYTFPLKYFPQQEVQINCGLGSVTASAPISVNLTGFRAGEVQKILLWLTNTANTTENGSHYWDQIKNVQLTYNGEIFFKATSSASQIWNLVCDTKEAGANIDQQDGSGGFENALSTYVDIPFAQVNVPYDKEIKLLHGKPILNAVVNISFTTPSVLSGDSWTLHAVYLYNASLLCSRGSSEYIF